MSMFRPLMRSLRAHFGPQRWWHDASRFEIVVGALLVQRTTWSNAERAIGNLRQRRILSIDAVARSDSETLATLIRPAGFFRTKAVRLKALAAYIASQGGFAKLDRVATPILRQNFLDREGVGPETADVILGYAFGRKVFVVDAYARRMFERLGVPFDASSDAALKKTVESALPDSDALNEFHALIVAHGKRYCRARPDCPACPLRKRCGYAAAEIGVNDRSA
jgi:endonuclease-3 related protein